MTGFALLGCGRVAPCHADAFALIDGVELRWACDVVDEQARELAARFGFARFGTDPSEVFSDPEVTLVALAVPHHLHAPLALQALQAGKHVLVEKPFSIQVAEGREVVEQARALGRVAAPVSQHRFDEALVLIRELVQSEALGRLHLVRAHLECFRTPDYYAGWRGKWATEGGSVLINQAYHLADQLLWMAGPVSQVTGRMTTFSQHMETEDALVASLSFESGALGALSVNGASGSLWDSYVELCGSHGAIAYDLAYPNKIHRLRLQSRKLWKNSQARFDELAANAPPPPPSLAYYGITHRQQAADFVASTRGSASRGASAEEALQAVDLIQRIYRACRT